MGTPQEQKELETAIEHAGSLVAITEFRAAAEAFQRRALKFPMEAAGLRVAATLLLRRCAAIVEETKADLIQAGAVPPSPVVKP